MSSSNVNRQCFSSRRPPLVIRRIAVLGVILIALIIPHTAAAAPIGPAFSGSFDRLSYAPNQAFRFTVVIRSTAPIQDAGVSFVVLSKSRGGKTLFEKTWDGLQLPAGVTRLEAAGRLAAIGARDGVFPAVVRLRAGEVVKRVRADLVVVDRRRHGEMLVSLVWNVNAVPTTSRKGVYLSRATAGLVRGGRNPGYLAMHVGKLARYPRTRVSFNIMPKLLHELLGVASGYRLKENGRIVSVRSDSPEAGDAETFLARMVELMRAGRVEAIPAPYAYPSLGELTARGWDQDVRLQISQGQDVVERALGAASTPGIFSPDLKLPLPAAKLMRRAGGEHSIVAPVGRFDPFRSYGVSVGNGRSMRVALADLEGGRIVASSPRGRVPRDLVAHLARVRLARGRRPAAAVIVVPAGGTRRPDGALVDSVYRVLAGTPWVRTVTVDEAVTATYRETARLRLPAVAVRGDTKSYYRRVDDARRWLAVYKKMARPDNTVARRLENNLLVAESLLWTQGGPGLRARGTQFASDVTQTVASELARISMPTSQTITLPAQSGKIPVTAVNGTRYRLKTELHLSGEQVDFPEGRILRMELRPRDNYLTVPVVVRTGGPARVNVKLVGGGVTLARSVVRVQTTYFDRMMLLAGVIVALIALLIVVYRKAGAGSGR